MNRRQYNIIRRLYENSVYAERDYAYSVNLSAQERNDLKKVRDKAATEFDNYLLNILNLKEKS